MPTISIVGSNGFVGRHLIEHLARSQEVSIRALVTNAANHSFAANRQVSVVVGDLLRPDSLQDLFEPGCVVVNLAYLSSCSREDNLKAVSNLVESCINGGVKRLIHCSTAVVAGRVSDDNVDEEVCCVPYTEYEITKYEIEQLLLTRSHGHLELIILRPTAIFGAGGKNLLKLAREIQSDSAIVNVIRSFIHASRKMNLVCVDNVVAAIDFVAFYSDNIDKQIFIVSDDECSDNNYQYVRKYLMKAFFVKDPSFNFPLLPHNILRLLLTLTGKSNNNPDRIYDSSKLLSFGYVKKVGFHQGLEAFVSWYKKSA